MGVWPTIYCLPKGTHILSHYWMFIPMYNVMCLNLPQELMALLEHLDTSKRGWVSLDQFVRALQSVKNAATVTSTPPLHTFPHRRHSEQVLCSAITMTCVPTGSLLSVVIIGGVCVGGGGGHVRECSNAMVCMCTYTCMHVCTCMCRVILVCWR